MAIIIEMPKLSDTMEEGAIASWQKKVGDFVEEGDVLVEIETDKATMEYESPEEGTLLKILVEGGSRCDLNAPIAVLGEEGEDADEALKEHGGGTSVSAGGHGDSVKEVPKKDDSPKAVPQSAASTSGGKVKASPLARKMAEKKGIDLQSVKGTGPNGRVIKRDLEGALDSSPVAATSSKSQAPSTSAASFAAPGAEDRVISLSMMRSTIAKRLGEAKISAPHFYLTRSINMDQAMAWRKEVNGSLAEGESKVSVNDIVIMAAAKALAHHPQVNASWRGDHILEYGNVHISMAVATEKGLVTPVITNTNGRGVKSIAAEAKSLVSKVKNGENLDYSGGTFTISNLGMFGIEEFTAIINPPQGAILAVGAAVPTPVVVNGEVQVAAMMKVTLSCDHRVIDGAVGAKFLQTLVKFLETPINMLT